MRWEETCGKIVTMSASSWPFVMTFFGSHDRLFALLGAGYTSDFMCDFMSDLL
jgi:hypothetical protein